jgi:hypothetical protein
MNRTEVYDHLAKIYLDASSKTKRKKRRKDYSRIVPGLFVAGTVALLCWVIIFFFISARNNKLLGSNITLAFTQEALKMDSNLDPAKKENCTLNLKNLNFKPFKTLALSVMKAEAQRNISVRIQLVNSLKEKSEMYLRNISNRRQDYRINLADFKGISNWSKISELSFVMEEWKVSSKKGVVYIDNVRLLK